MWTAKKCGYGDHRCNKKAKCIQNHDRVQRSKNENSPVRNSTNKTRI